MAESWQTTKETAARLRVSVATIRAWVREGVIPAARIRSNVLRFDPDAVDAAIRAGQPDPEGADR